MHVLHDEAGLRPFQSGVCVPTMGALHAGHLALIQHAAELRDERGAGPVIVTIFVNPTQFGPGEDFGRYPRTLDADLAVCSAAGADVVFAPEATVVYPHGADAAYQPEAPLVATMPGLEDAHRPTHFAGVLKVVYRLFELVRPSSAVFGEKDYQQLLSIRAMVKQEDVKVEIIARPTVRDEDGLALSSRNAYLAPAQRKRALGLSRALREAQQAANLDEAERRMRSVLLAHQIAIDYAVVRDATTLMPFESGEAGAVSRSARALIAGRVGHVRLIDNAAMQ